MTHGPLPEMPPYRPPSEAESVLVRVTRGCPWNRCVFCGMYKEMRFSVRPLDEIVRDLEVLAKIYAGANSVFLADSDSLVHPDLTQVVAAVRKHFPTATRVTSYARLTTLRRRPLEQLQAMREAGLTRVHAGLESGNGAVLSRARKGMTTEQAIEGGRKALAAGFELSLYGLCGLGGEDHWEDHARGTAQVVSEVWPHFLRLRSLVLLRETPLYELWQRKEFRPITPLSRLREVRLMIDELHGPAQASADDGQPMAVCSDHFSNLVWGDGGRIFEGAFGELPSERERLLDDLDRSIELAKASTRVEDPASMALRGRGFHL